KRRARNLSNRVRFGGIRSKKISHRKSASRVLPRMAAIKCRSVFAISDHYISQSLLARRALSCSIHSAERSVAPESRGDGRFQSSPEPMGKLVASFSLAHLT